MTQNNRLEELKALLEKEKKRKMELTEKETALSEKIMEINDKITKERIITKVTEELHIPKLQARLENMQKVARDKLAALDAMNCSCKRSALELKEKHLKKVKIVGLKYPKMMSKYDSAVLSEQLATANEKHAEFKQALQQKKEKLATVIKQVNEEKKNFDVIQEKKKNAKELEASCRAASIEVSQLEKEIEELVNIKESLKDAGQQTALQESKSKKLSLPKCDAVLSETVDDAEFDTTSESDMSFEGGENEITGPVSPNLQESLKFSVFVDSPTEK